MTARTPTKPTATVQPMLTLDHFYCGLRDKNPFVSDRVVQPGLAAEHDADVVHQSQFHQLAQLARTARDQHSGIGVVLWGEAGVGKSHLLSRLARWAHKDGRAVFVYLQNLQPGPDKLSRSLLRVTLSILTKGRQTQFHETPLYSLVGSAVQTALQENSRTLEPEKAYSRLLDRLSAQTPAQPAIVDRSIYNALFRFLSAAELSRTQPDDGVAGLAVRWLTGDPVDGDEARQLGLPPRGTQDDGMALWDDQQIKLVLVALSQMALFAAKPLLLCFDQVENVSPEQMQAQARFLQALLDSAPNLLVVTCGVRETLLRWRQEGVIQESSWDRIAQFEIALPRVSAHEAQQIVQKRLDDFMTSFVEELQPVKNHVQQDNLFPLGICWYEDCLKGKVDLRPRDVIRWARDAWAGEQQELQKRGGATWLKNWGHASPPPPPPPPENLGTLIDHKVACKLKEQVSMRQKDPETLPPDSDNLAGLVHTLLQQCLNGQGDYALTGLDRPAPPNRGRRPTYDLLAKHRKGGQEDSLGVLFLATGSAASTAITLRRTLEDPHPPVGMMLITDSRRPLKLGNKGKEYLEQLRRRTAVQFTQSELTFEQYAELDALNTTVGLANSQDLEIDLPAGQIHRVSQAEVIASHHRQARYASNKLLERLLGVASKPPEPDKQDACQFIMAQLALTLGASTYELTIKYVEYLKSTKHTVLDLQTSRPLLEDAARDLDQAGHVKATPCSDGYFLLPVKR